MPRIGTALKLLRERGAVGLAQKTVEWAARSVGLGVSFGSSRAIEENEGPHDVSVFERIYQGNLWSSSESASGPGSELSYTANYRRELIAVIKQKEIKSFFDAPCGDLNWMNEVIDATNIKYFGGDISPTAVALAKQRRPGADVRVFDICSDTFPNADVWHCRDCLFHLSFADIRRALSQFAASNIEYALITTNKALYIKNEDISTGDCRYVDLERPPIKLSKPILYLKDFEAGTHFPRYVGVWTREQIARALK